MKNIKIRARMIISYLIVAALLVISGVVSVSVINKVSKSMESFYENQFHTIENAWSARRSVYACRSAVLQAMMVGDASATMAEIDTAKSEFQTIKESIASVKQTFQGDMTLLTNCDTLLNQAETYLNQVSELAAAGQDEEAYRIVTESYKPLMDHVRANLSKASDVADANALAKMEESKKLASISQLIVFAMIVVSVIISIVLGLAVSESVRKPVGEMKSVCGEIVKGNMSVDIQYEANDELGDMANDMRQMTKSLKTIIDDIDFWMERMGEGDFTVESKAQNAYVGDYIGILNAFNKLRVSMNETLSQIDVSADQVNSGGEQVSSSAQALAQGSTEQASSVEELAATINDISHQIATTAEHAKTAKEENEQSHQQIEVCSSHMDELMKAMNVIDNKSKEISKVIKTIEDIAFQTNILALNAAVEAARAGSAGKGFAVVADEVCNLATKSQEASKSTGALIEETVKAVADGTRLSGETDQALREVVTSAQKVLDAVTLISTATEEETNSLAQVTTGIDQISSVVQTNSATAEQSAAASEELSGQANLLKEMVSRFTLSQSGGGMSRSSVSRTMAPSQDEFVPSGSSYDAGSRYGDKY